MLLFLLYILIFKISIAQNTAILQSKGTMRVFASSANAFIDAYNAAQPGDTIYLSGGYFSPVNINKKQLIIFGTGHHPDSTNATGISIITGELSLGENADSVVISGLYINGNITIGWNISANNVTIYRNYINGDIYFGGNRSNPSKYVLIKENILYSIFGDNTLNSTIANNIIHYSVRNFYNSSIMNNIFLNILHIYGYTNYIGLNNCLIINNIHNKIVEHFYNCNNNQFNNNIFINSPNFGSNNNSGNYLNVPMNDLFINQSGDQFNYSHNYHLKNPSVYIGTDGTEVGIYGGYYGPFKDGMLPINPHIIYKNIAPKTDSDGNLNIQIKVSAQNN